MNFANPRRIEESAPIHLPAIADFLEVARAVSAADDTTLDQLVKQSPRPEDIITLIRQTAPFTSYSLGSDRACEHSSLWVIPVLTARGSSRASRQGPSTSNMGAALISNWISEWFGFMNQARHFDFVPDYHVLSNMTAGEVRGALDALVSRRMGAKPQFRMTGAEQPDECLVPELSFVVGSVSRLNEEPTFPDGLGDRALRLRQKLTGLIGFQAADSGATDGSYWVGVPESFSAGLLNGLLYWAEAVNAEFVTEEFDVVPLGFDDVRLAWTVRAREDNQRFQISKHLRYSQLGRAGIEQVIASVSSSGKLKPGAQFQS